MTHFYCFFAFAGMSYHGEVMCITILVLSAPYPSSISMDGLPDMRAESESESVVDQIGVRVGNNLITGA